jgi:hypothetical protein
MRDTIKGLFLATRSNAKAEFLEAFLSWHMQICERGVVLLCRRHEESPDTVKDIVDKFNGRVRLVDFPEDIFHNGRTIKKLESEMGSEPECQWIMHLDKDEFVSDLSAISGIVGRIENGESDFAEGRMIDRFAVGGDLYESHYKSLQEFRRAAPVQTQIIGSFQTPDLKCYLTRKPHIHLHDHKKGWRKDKKGMLLEHYRWTYDLDERRVVRGKQHSSGIRRHQERRDREISRKSDRFQKLFREKLRPQTNVLAGWFDYSDVYRKVVEEAPEGATMVEIGVWAGRSIGYMSSYATAIGKSLNIVGYDQIDPTYYLGTPYKDVSTVEGWLDRLRRDLEELCPHNRPEIVRSNSVEAAQNHEDSSVFFCFIDGGHVEEQVTADIEAWIPKISKGGILAGHDLDHRRHAGVRRALERSNLNWRPISRSSWIAYV